MIIPLIFHHGILGKKIGVTSTIQAKEIDIVDRVVTRNFQVEEI